MVTASKYQKKCNNSPFVFDWIRYVPKTAPQRFHEEGISLPWHRPHVAAVFTDQSQ
jgi:hypothetical protein